MRPAKGLLANLIVNERSSERSDDVCSDGISRCSTGSQLCSRQCPRNAGDNRPGDLLLVASVVVDKRDDYHSW